jgi:hypothetical protein
MSLTVGAFLTAVGQVVLEYSAAHLVREARSWLGHPGALGALILHDGAFRRAAGRLVSWAGLDARGALIRGRNEATTQYIVRYQHEPILSAGPFRFPYSHCLSFIPGLPLRADPDWLTASYSGRFDLDSTIGIQGYKNAAVRFRENRKHQVPFPGSAVRISDWNGDTQFRLSEADYVDQFVTSQKEIVDEPLDKVLAGAGLVVPPRLSGVSLRQFEMQDARLRPFSASVLANTIGIATTVVTSDGYLILPRRNRSVHYEPGVEGCSVSGVVEWSQGLTTSFMR